MMRSFVALVGLLVAAPNFAHGGNPHRRSETFALKANDVVMATVGIAQPISPIPANVPRLAAPGLENSLALTTQIRNNAGVVTGYGTEHGRMDPATGNITTTWTLTLPARGTLFLSQTENGAPLNALIGDMLAHGELERTFDPPFELVTTVGKGDIVGGTGEFDDARGKFVERDFIHFISLISGALVVDDYLEVDFKK